MRAHPLWILLIVAIPAISAAETNDDDKQWRRELNQHFFIPSLAVVDPFVPTEFSITTGSGYAWVDGPVFDVHGNQIAGQKTYVAASLSETVGFQAAICSWWALRLSGGGGLYGGFNGPSALVLGASIPIDVTPGTTVSWSIGRFVRLGGTFDFKYQYSKVVDPLSAVRTSLAAGQVDTSQVSQRVQNFTVLPGVSLAIAPFPLVGILASAQYLWNGRDDGTNTVGVSYLALGISGQLDLKPLFPRAALGILASYHAQVALQSGQRTTQTVEGGLFYTGKKELALGLDVEGLWFDLRPGSLITFPSKAVLGSLVVRYFWN